MIVVVILTIICFAGEEQAIDQVIENKVRIEKLEEEQNNLDTTLNENKSYQMNYTKQHIEKEIDNLLIERNDVLRMREKWIDWVMMVLTAIVAFLGIGVTLYLYIRNRKQSREFGEQKERIEKIITVAESKKNLISRELRKFQRYSRARRNDFEDIITETENKKKELDEFYDEAKSTLYELVKKSLVEDKKINTHLSTIIDDILTEKQETNFDANDWYVKGNELYNISKYNDALNCYNKAVEFGLNTSDIFNSIAAIYDKLGINDKAERFYLHSISLDDKNETPIGNLGAFYAKVGRLNEAEDQYIKALTISPNMITFLNILELSIQKNDLDLWKEYINKVDDNYLSSYSKAVLLMLKSIASIIFFNTTFDIDSTLALITSYVKGNLSKIPYEIAPLQEWILETTENKVSYDASKIKTLLDSCDSLIKIHNQQYTKI